MTNLDIQKVEISIDGLGINDPNKLWREIPEGGSISIPEGAIPNYRILLKNIDSITSYLSIFYYIDLQIGTCGHSGYFHGLSPSEERVIYITSKGVYPLCPIQDGHTYEVRAHEKLNGYTEIRDRFVFTNEAECPTPTCAFTIT